MTEKRAIAFGGGAGRRLCYSVQVVRRERNNRRLMPKLGERAIVAGEFAGMRDDLQ